MGRGRGRPVHGYRGTVANRRENTRSGRTRSESRRKERKKKRVSTSFVHTNAINGVIFDFAGVSKSRPRNLFPFQNVPPPPPPFSSSFSSRPSKDSDPESQEQEEGRKGRRRGRRFSLVEIRSFFDRWGRGVGEAQRNRRTWIDDGDAAAVRERSGQAIEGGEAGGERLATLHSAGAERYPSRRNVEIITRTTDHAKYKYNCKLEIITRSTEI